MGKYEKNHRLFLAFKMMLLTNQEELIITKAVPFKHSFFS